MITIPIVLLFLSIAAPVWPFPAQSKKLFGPPLNNLIRQGPGGGAEHGVRQISKEECQPVVRKWLKNSETAAGSLSIERLELLMTLDTFSQAMPGFKPKRNELVAFGLFVDGVIESIAGVYWKKKSFPTEMEVITLGQHHFDPEQMEELLDFMDELCRENAIYPDYKPLKKFELFQDQRFEHILGSKPQLQLKDLVMSELTALYTQLNKAPSVCLDQKCELRLGHFWFHTSFKPMNVNQILSDVGYNTSDISIPLFFRQKEGRDSEFEVLFHEPEVGTRLGTGTVGGPLIVDLDSDLDDSLHSFPPVVTSNSEMIMKLVGEIRGKIHHPV